MFYIQQDNKIIIFNEDKQIIQNTLEFMPQYKGLEIKEVEEGYVIYDFELMPVEEMKEKQAQKECERLNMLSMTALDFIKALQSFGLTLEQINAYLEVNLAAKMQLTYCQNVYCGIVKALMPVTVGDITITADMIETVFKVKNSADSVEGV